MSNKKEKDKKCDQCEDSNLKGIHTCSKKPKKDDDSESKLWLIIGSEELPLGVAVAKTKGGAKRVYEKRTGKTRDLIYAQEMKFNKQWVAFPSLM